MSKHSTIRRRESDAGSVGTAFTVQNRNPTSSRRSSQGSAKTGVDVPDAKYESEWGASDKHHQDKEQSQAPGIDEIANTSWTALDAKGCRIGRGPTKFGHEPSSVSATDGLHSKLEAFIGDMAAPSGDRLRSGISGPSELSPGNESASAASPYFPQSLHRPTSPATAQSKKDGHEDTSFIRGVGSSDVPQSLHHSTSPMTADHAQSRRDGREVTSGSRLSMSRIGRGTTVK